MDPPEWEPPAWEPLASVAFVPRRTFGLAIATVAAWCAFCVNQIMIVFLLRQRTGAWRSVVEVAADEINLSAARLADDDLRTAINTSWILVAFMFVLGGLWVHGVATNGQRRGVPDVRPGMTAAQFALPIFGIGHALRELIRIMVTLRFAAHRLVHWSTAMLVFFFIWLGSYVIERSASAGSAVTPAVVDFLELQSALAAIRGVPIVVITALAVRAILHTDRSLSRQRPNSPMPPTL